jgi:sec-independent protein translocase protein TatC
MRPPRRLGNEEGADTVQHLDELRGRLVVCLVALAAGFGVAYVIHPKLLRLLNAALPPAHRHPVTFGIAEPFTTSLKVSLAAGLALALPIVLWQLWSYIAPAVEPHVQRSVAALVGFATALFATGVVFAYEVALPAAVHFLTSYDSDLYVIQVRAQTYYSFALTVMVAVGLVFELPVFVLALVRLRVLSSRTLRRKRKLGYAIVAGLAVALPGVDPVTTVFEMVPLMALFELSIWLAAAFERRWARQPLVAAGGAAG